MPGAANAARGLLVSGHGRPWSDTLVHLYYSSDSTDKELLSPEPLTPSTISSILVISTQEADGQPTFPARV